MLFRSRAFSAFAPTPGAAAMPRVPAAAPSSLDAALAAASPEQAITILTLQRDILRASAPHAPPSRPWSRSPSPPGCPPYPDTVRGEYRAPSPAVSQGHAGPPLDYTALAAALSQGVAAALVAAQPPRAVEDLLRFCESYDGKKPPGAFLRRSRVGPGECWRRTPPESDSSISRPPTQLGLKLTDRARGWFNSQDASTSYADLSIGFKLMDEFAVPYSEHAL